MKRGVEAGDLRQVGVELHRQPDRRQIMRLVQRRERTSASSSASSSGVTRAGCACRTPAMHDAMPKRRQTPAAKPLAQPRRMADNASLGVEGDFSKAGGDSVRPSRPAALAAGFAPIPSTCPENKPGFPFVDAEFKRGGAGIDNADQRFVGYAHVVIPHPRM